MKPLGIGAKVGGGLPPGYKWNVWFVQRVQEQLIKDFTHEAYEYLIQQIHLLAMEDSPSQSEKHRIENFEDFYEMKEKGGPLRSVNARIFFGIDPDERAIVIIHGFKKQNNGSTPMPAKLQARRNWRRYRSKEFPLPPR